MSNFHLFLTYFDSEREYVFNLIVNDAGVVYAFAMGFE